MRPDPRNSSCRQHALRLGFAFWQLHLLVLQSSLVLVIHAAVLSQKPSSDRPNRSTSPRCLCTWGPLPKQPCNCVLDGLHQDVDFLHILEASLQTIAVLEFMLTFQQLEDEVKVVVQTHADEIVTVDDTKQAWVSCRTTSGTDRSLRKPCFLNIAEKCSTQAWAAGRHPHNQWIHLPLVILHLRLRREPTCTSYSQRGAWYMVFFSFPSIWRVAFLENMYLIISIGGVALNKSSLSLSLGSLKSRATLLDRTSSSPVPRVLSVSNTSVLIGALPVTSQASDFPNTLTCFSFKCTISSLLAFLIKSIGNNMSFTSSQAYSLSSSFSVVSRHFLWSPSATFPPSMSSYTANDCDPEALS